MADPLSISSGIAGLLSLSISIADKLFIYVSSVRNAPKTIRAYLHEVTSLKTILFRLDELVRQSGKLDVFAAAGSALSEVNVANCRQELERIDAGLQKRLKESSALHNLTWPFAENLVRKDVEMLQRYRATFQMALSADAVAIGGRTLEEVQSLSSTIRQDAATARDKTIMKWLCPGGIDETHTAVSARRLKDTGIWFIKKIDAWLTDDAAMSIFWCRGIPGAGKTVLMSAVVDHTAAYKDHYRVDAVAYVYFNYKQQNTQTPDYIFANILAQLCSQITKCQDGLGELYDKSADGTRKPNLDSLVKLLIDLSNSFSILLAFDALDEAAPKTRQALVKQLAKPEMANLRVFVTSRPDVDLKTLAMKIETEDIVAQDKDIEAYAKTRLEESEDIQDILEGHVDTVVPRIVANVLSHAAGMFLLVVFQIEYICQQTSAKEMLEASRTMPSEASSIYAQTLEQIDSQSKSQAKLAREVLCWLVLAKSTLSVAELQDAIAIEPGNSALDPLNRRSIAMLVKVCRGLVVVERDFVIRLAHLTVQEFLVINLPEIASMRMHIATACLSYLCFDAFDAGPAPSAWRYLKRTDAYPFYAYACRNFSKHLQDSGAEEKLTPTLMKFVGKPSTCQSFLQMFFFEGFTTDDYFLLPEFCTSFHLAAALGSACLAKALLADSKASLDQEDGDHRTPLHWAIQYGHVDVADVFVQAGANQEHEKESALNCAARFGQDSIVRLLLEQSMTGNAQQASDERDLFVAAITGDEDSTIRLLNSGVNAHATDHDGGTALQWACWYGHTSVAAQLISAGADIEARDKNGRRGIHEACERGHFDVVKLLCESGCDIEARDKFDFTPLCRAAFSGGSSVAELLLDRGADINVKVYRIESVLHVALGSENVSMARLLLERGYDATGFSVDDVVWYQYPNWRIYRKIEKMIRSSKTFQGRIEDSSESEDEEEEKSSRISGQESEIEKEGNEETGEEGDNNAHNDLMDLDAGWVDAPPI